MKMRLKDKVAIVTGSGQGIGREIALTFAKEGAKVVVTDITDKIYEVAKEIEALGSEALAIKCDVSSAKDTEEMAKKTLEKFGRIDILVNNAGIFKSSQVVQMNEKDWDKIIDVNLKGIFLCSKAVLQKMVEQKYGKIINISSIDGAAIGIQGSAHYSASKAGIVGFTRCLALEVAQHGINVNAIAPGAIRTPMLESGLKELGIPEEQIIKMIPLGRIGEPKDIANLALFLASDESSYITGQTIIADGGWTIQ